MFIYRKDFENLNQRNQIPIIITISPYMINMWPNQYADNNQGFCIEYEMPDIYHRTDELFSNLFPVIYSDARTDVLNKCLEYNEKEEWDPHYHLDYFNRKGHNPRWIDRVSDDAVREMSDEKITQLQIALDNLKTKE